MLDMTPTVQSICRKREHGNPPGPMHTDMAACDAYEAQENEVALGEVLGDISDAISDIAGYRAAVTEREDDLSRLVIEAFKYGATGPQLARVTGLSRARIYQIRDGRR